MVSPSSISQVELLMSTFRIPRRCEIGVGLLLELLKPPHKNSCLVKWKSVHDNSKYDIK